MNECMRECLGFLGKWLSWFLIAIVGDCIFVVEFYALFDVCSKIRIWDLTFHVFVFCLFQVREVSIIDLRGRRCSYFVVRMFVFRTRAVEFLVLRCSIPNSLVDTFKFRCSSCWVSMCIVIFVNCFRISLASCRLLWHVVLPSAHPPPPHPNTCTSPSTHCELEDPTSKSNLNAATRFRPFAPQNQSYSRFQKARNAF